MAYRDLYNVLGVSKSATPDEIKKAYRKLALQWHPDRTGGDEAGAQRFKDISLAYKTLSDAEERARYDRLGPLYTADGRPMRPDELNETVAGIVGRFFRRDRNHKGKDLRYTLTLDLEDVVTGCKRTISVPRQIRCRTCGGDGARPGDGKTVCDVCTGTGRSQGRILRASCYHCSGGGFVVVHPCETCDGEGRRGTEDALEVTVPAGVATGQKLKVAGKGDAPTGSGTEGDLLVVIHIAEHPLFRRRGDDVLLDVPLTFTELALGADVDVPILEGTTTVRINAATPPGQILRLAGRGLPRTGGGPRGDLHLQLRLDLPTDLTDEQRSTLTRWSKSLDPSAHSRRSAFDDAVRERR
ncbi:MAG: DnaJ C-terminal domain-containing protein [Myxococcota bacterium]